MKPATRSGRLAAWIALFAILLATLAPSVARALMPPQHAMPWTDICTVAGSQTAHERAPASGSGQHEGADFKHCPFCLTHADHLALPARAAECFPAAAAAEPVSLPVATPPSRLIRVAAQPRAPPACS